MKWLIPFHTFEIASLLSATEAMQALAQHTEPEKVLRWRWPSSTSDDRFEGVVSADSFHVRRIIGYRNSFLPVVDGVITASGRRAMIVVRMRPFIFVFAFLAVWCVGVGTILFTTQWPIGIAMLAFVYIMTTGGFWFEAAKQERVLRRIFRDQAS